MSLLLDISGQYQRFLFLISLERQPSVMQHVKYLKNDQTALNKNEKGMHDVCIHLPTQGTGYTPAS